MTPGSAAAAVDHYRREWSAAHASLPGAGVGWVDRVRREALDRFCERGFPTPRDEDWKYTNVRPIERRAFRLDPDSTGGVGGAAGRAAEPTIRGGRLAGLAPAARIVFLNGRLAPAGRGRPAGCRRGSGSTPSPTCSHRTPNGWNLISATPAAAATRSPLSTTPSSATGR